MHTPAGYTIVEGRFEPADWWQIVFNPSFPYRLVHTVLGAYLTTAFVVGGVGAWHLLKGHWDGASQRMFSMAMWMAALVAPLQAIAGDFHGLNTLEHQPAKIAAMEGHFETHAGAPLYLFGLPDLEAETTHYAIGIPKLGSLILGHSWDAELKGLKAFPRDQWPNAPVIFWTFRLMVGIGFLMIGIGLVSLWLRWHKRLYDAQWFLRLCVLASPLGFFAVTFGWITTEHGRQPWVVYGLMRTADAVSPHPAGSVLASLVMFVVVYCVVFGAGTYYLLRLMREVPSAARGTPSSPGGQRPMAAADERLEPGGSAPAPAE
jgi:cytochrome bd ubiquinol oxidase subunit I